MNDINAIPVWPASPNEMTLRDYYMAHAPAEEIDVIIPSKRAEWLGIREDQYRMPEHYILCLAKARALWADAMLAERATGHSGHRGYGLPDLQRIKMCTQVGTTTHPYMGGILNEMNEAMLRAGDVPKLHDPDPTTDAAGDPADGLRKLKEELGQ